MNNDMKIAILPVIIIFLEDSALQRGKIYWRKAFSFLPCRVNGMWGCTLLKPSKWLWLLVHIE